MSKDLRISIEKVFVTSGVSSGSGLVVQNDMMYVVGDDAEYLGKLVKGDTQCSRLPLYANAGDARMPKAVKHDLECAALGKIGEETYLFAFGSGVVSPYRDTLFAMDVSGKGTNMKRSLKPVYDAIKAKAGLKDNELNIEGATVAGDKLYLLNRGKNLVISFDWNSFAGYMLQESNATLPGFEILPVALPVVNSFPIGFSGACTLYEHTLLFTASLEETSDFRLDGPVKGSYLGVLDMKQSAVARLVALTEVKDDKGASISDKLESIDVLNRMGKLTKAAAVADNDNGSSKIYYLSIEGL